MMNKLLLLLCVVGFSVSASCVDLSDNDHSDEYLEIIMLKKEVSQLEVMPSNESFEKLMLSIDSTLQLLSERKRNECGELMAFSPTGQLTLSSKYKESVGRCAFEANMANSLIALRKQVAQYNPSLINSMFQTLNSIEQYGI